VDGIYLTSPVLPQGTGKNFDPGLVFVANDSLSFSGTSFILSARLSAVHILQKPASPRDPCDTFSSQGTPLRVKRWNGWLIHQFNRVPVGISTLLEGLGLGDIEPVPALPDMISLDKHQ
jgi:hypothetical protein